MGKVAKSKYQKTNEIIFKYPKEFKKGPSGTLMCSLCLTEVNCGKAFNVESHRNGIGHKNHLAKLNVSNTFQTTLVTTKNDFSYKVVNAFLQSDIPLHKLRSPALKKLFSEIGYNLPPETSCRRHVEEIFKENFEKIKNLIQDKKIFLICDESSINDKKYLHILVGTISNPKNIYLAKCSVLPKSPDQNMIVVAIDDALKELEVLRSNFYLLLSDAAPYMIAAGRTLKLLYDKMFHVTCIAHLLHNCAMVIQSNFPDVNQLIASVKFATVKNSQRRAQFDIISCPPDVVLTRWGSWLKAAIYYADNLPEIAKIVGSFVNTGKLVENAQSALNATGLASQLMKIKRQYSCLIELIEQSESREFSIHMAQTKLAELHFQEDSCSIRSYIDRRITKNDLGNIMSLSNPAISPTDYSLLHSCPATSVEVERSFSMLGKLLAKDRNFSDFNIDFYICVLFNKF